MDEVLREFQQLLEQLPKGDLASSLELLLYQLEPDSAEQLKLCAIPHQFNLDILPILVPELGTDQAQARCDEFAELAIITIDHDNLIIHDEARRYLFNQWLEPANRSTFIVASTKLVEYFDKHLTEVTDEQQEVIAHKRMFHLLGARPAAGFSEFERLFEQTHLQFRLSKCQSLINLVHEYDQILTPEQTAQLAYHEGILATDWYQWSRAEELFNQILANNNLPPKLHAQTYNRLGVVYAGQQAWQTAIDFQQKALQLANTLTDSNDLICHILHDLGSAHRDNGDLTQASRLFQEAIELAKKEQNYFIISLIYNSLGSLYLKLNDTPQAIVAYENTLRYLEQLQDQFRPAQVYNNLGLVYADLHDWQQSEHFFQQSLEIKRQAGDIRGQAITLTNLITVYQNLGNQPAAIETSQQAIKLFDELHDLYNLALVKRHFAKLYHNLSHQTFTEAIELFNRCHQNEEAVATSKELDTLFRKERIPSWIWILLIFIFLIETFSIVIDIEDFIPLDINYINEGDKNHSKDQYDEAIINYTKAIKIRPNNDWAYKSRGEVYVKLGKYDEALADYNQAIKINPNQDFYYATRGHINFKLGRRDEGLADYNQAIRLRHHLPSR
jgi:tetratricopeptide (TPR) repeat protein